MLKRGTVAALRSMLWNVRLDESHALLEKCIRAVASKIGLRNECEGKTIHSYVFLSVCLQMV